MRVISGTARGKKLNSVPGLETRPTLDRVKEALFNILQFNIKEKVILDLFSGSGALGIEALSRGANEAVFCDNSNKAISIIKLNLEQTNLINKAIIFNKNYIETLSQLSLQKKKYDIIFLDPPYKSNYGITAIEMITKNNLLNENGIIVFETDDKSKIDEIKNNKEIEVYDVRKYGIVLIIFIRKG